MSGYNLKKNIILLSGDLFFTFTNSVDLCLLTYSDEMHNAAFHLGLHCLQKYLFRGFPNSIYSIHFASAIITCFTVNTIFAGSLSEYEKHLHSK